MSAKSEKVFHLSIIIFRMLRLFANSTTCIYFFGVLWVNLLTDLKLFEMILGGGGGGTTLPFSICFATSQCESTLKGKEQILLCK